MPEGLIFAWQLVGTLTFMIGSWIGWAYVLVHYFPNMKEVLVGTISCLIMLVCFLLLLTIYFWTRKWRREKG